MTPQIPEKTFFKIGEVSEIVGVKPHIVRYWESEFRQIRLTKTRSGQRLFRRRDIELILAIRVLVQDQQFTIAGAKQRLKELLAAKVPTAELVETIASMAQPAEASTDAEAATEKAGVSMLTSGSASPKSTASNEEANTPSSQEEGELAALKHEVAKLAHGRASLLAEMNALLNENEERRERELALQNELESARALVAQLKEAAQQRQQERAFQEHQTSLAFRTDGQAQQEEIQRLQEAAADQAQQLQEYRKREANYEEDRYRLKDALETSAREAEKLTQEKNAFQADLEAHEEKFRDAEALWKAERLQWEQRWEQQEHAHKDELHRHHAARDELRRHVQASQQELHLAARNERLDFESSVRALQEQLAEKRTNIHLLEDALALNKRSRLQEMEAAQQASEEARVETAKLVRTLADERRQRHEVAQAERAAQMQKRLVEEQLQAAKRRAADAVDAHQSELLKLRESHENETRVWQELQEEQSQQALRSARAQWEEKLDALRADYIEKLRGLSAQIEAEKSQAEQRTQQFELRELELQIELDDQEQEFQRQLAHTQSAAAEDRERALQEAALQHRSELEDLRRVYQARTAELQESLEQSAQKFLHAQASNAEFADEIGRLNAELSASAQALGQAEVRMEELSKSQEELRWQNEQARQETERALDTLRAHHRDASEALEVELTLAKEAQVALQQRLESAQRQALGELDATRLEAARERQEALKTLEVSLRAAYDENLAHVHARFEREIEEANDECIRAQKRYQAYRERVKKVALRLQKMAEKQANTVEN